MYLFILTIFNEGTYLTFSSSIFHKALKVGIITIWKRASVSFLMLSAKQGNYWYLFLVWPIMYRWLNPGPPALEVSTLWNRRYNREIVSFTRMSYSGCHGFEPTQHSIPFKLTKSIKRSRQTCFANKNNSTLFVTISFNFKGWRENYIWTKKGQHLQLFSI